MHRRMHRRIWDGEQPGHAIQRRRPQAGTGSSSSNDGDDNHTNVPLTRPITITITRTVVAGSTSAAPSATTSSIRTHTIISSSNDHNYDAPPQTLHTLLSMTSTSSIASPATSSVETPPLPTVTGTNNNAGNGNSSISPVSGATQPRSLPAGALIGIVITCIFLFLGTLIFGIRRRYVRKRLRMRKEWTNSKGVRPSLDQVSDEPKVDLPPQPALTATTPKSSTMPIATTITAAAPTLALPPAAYGNEPLRTPSPSPKKPSPGLIAPVYGPPVTRSSTPIAATVISTFITTLPDELSITVGETLSILAEYDDGWALCLNARGEQGMVPLECLDRGFTTTDDMNFNRGVGGNLRRVSSLQPTIPDMRHF